MKERLDQVSLPNFVRAAEGALARSGATLADVVYLCGIHMKRSMHDALVEALGVDPSRAAYLDDTGHMSGVDPLSRSTARARRASVADGDLVLLLAAGTGYTWAASVVRWGEACRWRPARDSARAAGSRSTRSGSTRLPRQRRTGRESTSTPRRRRPAPYGTTVAHGFLTLSLVVPLLYEVAPRPDGVVLVNYGVDRVRFPSAVPAGSQVRAVFDVVGVDEVPGGRQATLTATVEREGGDKPVCVAQLLLRILEPTGGDT